jgi:hypothetical protein
MRRKAKMRRRHLKFLPLKLFNHPLQPPPFEFIQPSFEIIQNKIMTISFAEDVVFVPTRAMRIENAKQFLKDNLIKIIACAARIHDLTESTLYRSISRQKKEKNEDQIACERRGGYNKMLQNDEFIMNTVNDSTLSLQQMNEQADYMTFDLEDENYFEHDEDDCFN